MAAIDEAELMQRVNNLPAELNPTILRSFAQSLPLSVQVVRVKRRGSEILRLKLCAPEERKYVIPGKMYTGTGFVPIKTGTGLVKAFKKNGRAGVSSYMRRFIKNHKMIQERYGDNPALTFGRLTAQKEDKVRRRAGKRGGKGKKS